MKITEKMMHEIMTNGYYDTRTYRYSHVVDNKGSRIVRILLAYLDTTAALPSSRNIEVVQVLDGE